MTAVTHVIIWWAGALLAFGLLVGLTAVLGSLARLAARHVTENVLWLVNVVIYRYWIGRMRTEGFMVLSEHYQRLVREQKPKTPADYARISKEADALDGTNYG